VGIVNSNKYDLHNTKAKITNAGELEISEGFWTEDDLNSDSSRLINNYVDYVPECSTIHNTQW
jgi:hypothetical protein